jgi:Zn-dependent protease with chaperone function
VYQYWAMSYRKFLIRNESVPINENVNVESYKVIKKICSDYNIKIPKCFIRNDSSFNAFTFGIFKPYVVISKGLYKKVSKKELKAVFAHELAHIKHKDSVIRIADALSNFVFLKFFFSFIAKIFIFFRRADYRLAEVRADVEALKQTDLKTMEKLFLRFLGIDDNSVTMKQLIKDYEKDIEKIYELRFDHPTPVHRYIILKKANDLIEKGKEEFVVGNKTKHVVKLVLGIIFFFSFLIFFKITWPILLLLSFSIIYNLKMLKLLKKNAISLQ